MNRKVLLAARPVGLPKLSDFSFSEEKLPEPRQGELLIEAHYLSADPLQRWRMEAKAGYGDTIGLGEMMWGRMVGKVLRSRNPDWREGDFAEGMLGWQEFAISRGETAKGGYAKGIGRVEPAAAPLSTALGILGMPGVTAYFALLEICKPQAGETVVVSAAAGAVGSLAGQIAKILGCRVVGIVGSPEKARHVIDELGFDAAIDYRSTPDLGAELRAACPDRIDAYFDNVGGAVADAVYRQLAKRARIAVVGRVAQLEGSRTRADPQELLIAARARVEGFIVYDYESRAGEARAAIGGWLRSGKLQFRETVHEGIESAPQALIDVLQGKGIGKHVIRLERK
jgi:NADPH-dependent curcumin reductase CurA